MAKLARHKEQTCCGVIQEAKYEARAKREARTTPTPWIILKLAVGLTVGIIGYASYVYIARLCVPMLVKKRGTLGSQATGIVFMVVFCPLLVMISWSYAKVVLTPPGFARDYIPKSAEPKPPPPANIGGTPYESILPRDPWARRASGERERTDSVVTLNSPSKYVPPSEPSKSSEKPTDAIVSIPAASHQSGRPRDGARAPDANAGTPDAPPVPMADSRYLEEGQLMAPGALTRRPPTTPVLSPIRRYCYTDNIIKPYRAHHCRACATCVLKYDHHCPWVGQCVGARNHKFFVNFVFWAALFCLWVFATVLVFVVKEGASPDGNFDIQEIVIVALAGIFALFTVSLFITHTYMISMNQTTVESVSLRAMKEREAGTLAMMFACYDVAAKQRTRREWDREWGRIDREGNIWWLGGTRENWESVMGKSVWWWFLPIGHSSSDGLHYPVNPRFDTEGRWLPRSKWLAELR